MEAVDMELDEPERYYNVVMVAKLLAMKTFTIRKWARQNKLRSIKISNRLLFKKEWIDEFVTSQSFKKEFRRSK